jgi:DNA modification methylase
MIDTIFTGDALNILNSLPGETVQTCVTSPPYFGLRDYGVKGQMGLEDTPEAYVQKMVQLFREIRRLLRTDGTLWLNLGDSYAGSGKGACGDGIVRLGHKSKKQKTSNGTHQGIFAKPHTGLKPKDLIGIPWRVAFALQTDGWYLRQDIIWHKPNPMPESVTDRCTKGHEYIFLLSKSPKYYFDHEAIKYPSKNPTDDRGARGNRKRFPTALISGIRASGVYPMANKRSVWTVNTKPYKGAHFATFPPDLIEPCILAGAPKNGVVLDPFVGSGTTAAVAKKFGRHYVGIELNPVYVRLARERCVRRSLPWDRNPQPRRAGVFLAS